MDGLLIVNARPEIFALQHLLQRHATVETNDIFERHRPKPVTVANSLRPSRIEDFECLLTVGGGIGHDFLVRQLRSRN